MIKTAAIDIEKFDNGITSTWYSEDAVITPKSRRVALEGSEANCIGTEIWEDLKDIFAASGENKITITLNYEVIKED